MNRSRTTTTRTIRPAPTRPRESCAEMRKVSRRPSMLSRTASALPRCRPTWAPCARLHLIADRRRARSSAVGDRLDARLLGQCRQPRCRQDRHIAAPDAIAVSASVTTSVTDALRPVEGGMRLTIGEMIDPDVCVARSNMRCAPVEILPRSSWKIVALRVVASTTLGSKSWCPGAARGRGPARRAR